MLDCLDIIVWFAMWLTATSTPGELSDGALSALKQLTNVWDSIYWNDDIELQFFEQRLCEIRCIFFRYICARRALYNYVCKYGVRDCSFFNFFVSNFVEVAQQFPFWFNDQTDSYINIVKQGLAVYKGLKYQDGNLIDQVRAEQMLLRKVSRRHIRRHFQCFKHIDKVLSAYQNYLSRSTAVYTYKEVPQQCHQKYDCVDGVLIETKVYNLNKVLEQMLLRKMNFKVTNYAQRKLREDKRENQDKYWAEDDDRWAEDDF